MIVASVRQLSLCITRMHQRLEYATSCSYYPYLYMPQEICGCLHQLPQAPSGSSQRPGHWHLSHHHGFVRLCVCIRCSECHTCVHTHAHIHTHTSHSPLNFHCDLLPLPSPHTHMHRPPSRHPSLRLARAPKDAPPSSSPQSWALLR